MHTLISWYLSIPINVFRITAMIDWSSALLDRGSGGKMSRCYGALKPAETLGMQKFPVC